jgi:microcystin-dependent protein
MLTSFLSRQPVYDQQRLAVGAKIFTYDAGTSNARIAYRDGSNSPQPWTQPFFTDVNGQIPTFWISGTTGYRVRVLSAQNVQLLDIDNLTAEVALPVFPTVAGYGLSTGDILARFDTAEIAGFVKLNGKTLGSASSGADYASDSNSALFTLLYNGIVSLTVSGGRGANASADFTAAKTMTLPDLRSRALFGLDTMGAAAASRLTFATFITGSSSVLGSVGGEAAHILTIGELATHTHTGTTDAAGAHTPAGTLDTQGAHTHSGTTSAGSAHHHSYTAPAPQIVNAGTGVPITLNGANAQTLNTVDENVHTHTYTTDSQGSHSHTFTGTAVASHTHTFTSGSIGGNFAHNTMPPFMLVTFYCKV